MSPPSHPTPTSLKASLGLSLSLLIVLIVEFPSFRSVKAVLILSVVVGVAGEGVRRVGWTEGGVFPNWNGGSQVGKVERRIASELPGSLIKDEDGQGSDGEQATQQEEAPAQTQMRQRTRPTPVHSSSSQQGRPSQSQSQHPSQSHPQQQSQPQSLSTTRTRSNHNRPEHEHDRTQPLTGSTIASSSSALNTENSFRSAFEAQYDVDPEAKAEAESEHDSDQHEGEHDEDEDQRDGGGSADEEGQGMDVDSVAGGRDGARSSRTLSLNQPKSQNKGKKRALSITSATSSTISRSRSGRARGGGGKRRHLGRRAGSGLGQGRGAGEAGDGEGERDEDEDEDEDEEMDSEQEYEQDEDEDQEMSIDNNSDDQDQNRPNPQRRSSRATPSKPSGKKRDISEADIETDSISSGRGGAMGGSGRMIKRGRIGGERKVSGLRNVQMGGSGSEDGSEGSQAEGTGSAEDEDEMDVDHTRSNESGPESNGRSDGENEQDGHSNQEEDSDGDLLPPRLRHTGSPSNNALQTTTSQSRIQLRPSASSSSVGTSARQTGRKRTSNDQAARQKKTNDVVNAASKARSQAETTGEGSGNGADGDRKGANGKGRKVGDQWTVGDVRYRMEKGGKVTRSVEIKDWRPKFKMPKDSKHPDAQTLHLVLKEVWLTDEQLEQAKERRELAGQSSDEETHAKHVPPTKPAPGPLPRTLYHLQSPRTSSPAGVSSPRAGSSSLSGRASTPTRRVLSMSTSRNGSRSSSAAGTPVRTTSALPLSTPSVLGGASMKLAQSQSLQSLSSSTRLPGFRPSGLGASGSGNSSPVPQRRSVKQEHAASKEKMILEQLAKDGIIKMPASPLPPAAVEGEPTAVVADKPSTSVAATVGSGALVGGSGSGSVAAPATAISSVSALPKVSSEEKPSLLAMINSGSTTQASVGPPKSAVPNFGQFGSVAMSPPTALSASGTSAAVGSDSKPAASPFTFAPITSGSSAAPSAPAVGLGLKALGATGSPNPFSSTGSPAPTPTSEASSKAGVSSGFTFGSGSGTPAGTSTPEARPTAGMRRTAIVASNPSPALGLAPSTASTFNFSRAATSGLGASSSASPVAANSKPAQAAFTFGTPGASAGNPAAAPSAFGQNGATGSPQPSSGVSPAQARPVAQSFAFGNGQQNAASSGNAFSVPTFGTGGLGAGGGLAGTGQANAAAPPAKPFNFAFTMGKP